MTPEQLRNLSAPLLLSWRSYFDSQMAILHKTHEQEPFLLPEFDGGSSTLNWLTNEAKIHDEPIRRAVHYFLLDGEWTPALNKIESFLIRRRLAAGHEVMELLANGDLFESSLAAAMPPLEARADVITFFLVTIWNSEMETMALQIAAQELDDQRPSRAREIDD